MKKVKIMLAAITVLASVGGALAFKAKTFNQNYCIRSIAAGSGACTTSLVGRTLLAQVTYYFTTTSDLTKCTNNNVQCVPTTKLIGE